MTLNINTFRCYSKNIAFIYINFHFVIEKYIKLKK